VRRSLHRPPPPDLIDDMYVSLSVLCSGSRIVHVADAIAYEEAVSQPAEEFRRKIRIACQAFNVNRALWPALMALPFSDKYKYVSHKLLRWFSIYSLAGFALCVFLAVLTVGDRGLDGAVLCAGIAVGFTIWLMHWGPVGKLREILGAMLATGIGVMRSWQGERFQTWNPPASARKATIAVAGE
jgi:hypothetical protein